MTKYLLAIFLCLPLLADTAYFRTGTPGVRTTITSMSQGTTGPVTITVASDPGWTTGTYIDIMNMPPPCWAINGIKQVTRVTPTTYTLQQRAASNTGPFNIDTRSSVGFTNGACPMLGVITYGGLRAQITSVAGYGTLPAGRTGIAMSLGNGSDYTSIPDGATVTVQTVYTCSSTFGGTMGGAVDGEGIPAPVTAIWKRTTGTSGQLYELDGTTVKYCGGQGYAQYYNAAIVPVAGVVAPVTINANLAAADIALNLSGKVSTIAGTGLHSRAVTMRNLVNAPADPTSRAQSQVIAASGNNALLLCAVDWMMTGESASLDCAKRALNHFEFMLGGGALFGSDHRAGNYNGAYQFGAQQLNLGDQTKGAAIIWNQLTAAEQQRFADKILNGAEDGCVDQLTYVTPGRATVQGGTVIGNGTSFTTQFAVDDVVVINQQSDAEGVENPFGQFQFKTEMVFVDAIYDDTHMKLSRGSYTAGTLTLGTVAPTGACTTGNTHINTANNFGTWTGPQSYACVSSAWTTSGVQVFPMGVVKKFSQSAPKHCGYLHFIGGKATSNRANYWLYNGAGISSIDGGNLQDWNSVEELLATLSLVGRGDSRATRRLELEYNRWYDYPYPGIRKMWAGQSQYGSGYYGDILGFVLEPQIALYNATSGVINNLGRWVDDSAYAYLYSYKTNNPAQALRFGDTPTVSGPSVSSFWRRGPLWEKALELNGNSTLAALYRGYYFGKTGLHTSARYSSTAQNDDKSAVLQLMLSQNEAGTTTDPATLPLQRLFRATQDAANGSQVDEMFSSRSGWGASDTQLVVYATTTDRDHNQVFSAGAFQIIKKREMSAGALNTTGVTSCENDAGLPCFGGNYGNNQNIIQIGCGPDNCDFPFSITDKPHGDPTYTTIDRWAGTDPTGVADGSYTYARVNNSTYYRTSLAITGAWRHFLHLKKSGQQDYIIVYDDLATSTPTTFCALTVHLNNGVGGDGTSSWSSGTRILSSNGAASTSTTLNTFFLGPNSAQQHFWTDSTVASGSARRNRDCITSDGSTAASVTAAEFSSIWQPGATGVTMPTVSALGTIDTGWRSWQIADATQPYVAVIRQGNSTPTSLTFTSTHSGTGKYVIAGLGAQTYSITRNGSALTTCTVASGDNTCSWDGLAGAYVLTATGGPPTIVTASIPNGNVGTAYSTTLALSGGSSPFTWTVTSGSLPTGLTLGSTTGTISGTPTVAATSSFQITLTDATSTTANRTYTPTIYDTQLYTRRVVPGDTSIYYEFGIFGLLASVACTYDLATDAGFSSIVATGSGYGGAVRGIVATGLSANTSYYLRATCGLNQATATGITTGTGGGATTVTLSVPTKYSAIDGISVAYGSTSSLGLTATGTCSAGLCTVSIPGTSKRPLYYRSTLTIGGVTRVPQSATAVVIPN